MKRIRLTGEDAGKWFDLDTAIKFDEAQRWDGRNHISRATGDQWEHQTLYYTKAGRWVLHHMSQWQGSLDTWSEVTDLIVVVNWLVANDCLEDEGYSQLPSEIWRRVQDAVAAKEV